jgi:glycosyltransferase involved in cell wall biosynthesis
MNPKVSICLPSLNTRPFLPERLDTILAQTFQDWELIVVDSYSDDGSWELIQDYAKREPRMQIFQEPRQGIYAGFNSCIRRTSGEYIYIATSDDTMTPDCLEKMVAALEQNSDCDLCQCALEFIDEHSKPLPEDRQWNQLAIGNYFKAWLRCSHKRFAPHDGVLHFAVLTVYTSVTQLLIRKRLFDAIGYFETDRGSMADFEWEMRASLLYNTIYIPHVLASWRIHSTQATTNPYTSTNLKILLGMARQALNFAKKYDVQKVKNISFNDLSFVYKMSIVTVGINERKRLTAKLFYLLRCIFELPEATSYYIISKLFFSKKNRQRDPVAWIAAKIVQLKIYEPIKLPSV